jgi:hypothetical protein
VVEQGTHKPLDLTAVLPQWELIGEVLSYGLYWRQVREHITPIERIPESAPNGRSRRRDNPKAVRVGEHLRKRDAARRQRFSVNEAPAAARRGRTVMRS